MGYVPKFIHLDHFINVVYPFGSSLRGIDEVGATRFIVVDDFIASGETIEAIIRELDWYFNYALCK